jgi:hypothetical protein
VHAPLPGAAAQGEFIAGHFAVVCIIAASRFGYRVREAKRMPLDGEDMPQIALGGSRLAVIERSSYRSSFVKLIQQSQVSASTVNSIAYVEPTSSV